MPHAFSLPRISTNVRFAASHLLFPELAGAWAERLFLTPPRSARRRRQRARSDRRQKLAISSTRAGTSRCGAWGARPRMRRRCCSRTAGAATPRRCARSPSRCCRPATASSPTTSRRTACPKASSPGLPDFADVLGAVARHHGGIDAVIAHSLGGAGAALALAWGKATLPQDRARQPALRPRRLFAPLRALVLDARAGAQGDAGRDRGALRRALGRARGRARRAAPGAPGRW